MQKVKLSFYINKFKMKEPIKIRKTSRHKICYAYLFVANELFILIKSTYSCIKNSRNK